MNRDSNEAEIRRDRCVQPTLAFGVDKGRAPLLMHDAGVFFRGFFDPAQNYVERIQREHAFQALTESNKPSKAHRTGIYLTPVEQKGDELHFRLLRCSTNLSGPTDNFRATDHEIVDALNQTADEIFSGHARLNHVLAQIYRNKSDDASPKQVKAKIQAHADKTKDMPKNGIMAFCTFYEGLDRLMPLDDGFDFGQNGVSGLTKLHFRRKRTGAPATDESLPEQFTIVLYPGSVFFMPLSTNRLYTHEIRSSMLHASELPTRLGYVVRCSKTEAVHVRGATFLKKANARQELRRATFEGVARLRERYAEENNSDGFVDYGDEFDFSMNLGDYRAPEL